MDEDYASLDISLNSFAQTRMDISTEEVPASQSESVSMLAQNTQTDYKSLVDDSSNPTIIERPEPLWGEKPYRAYTHGPPDETVLKEHSQRIRWTRGYDIGYYSCNWVIEPDPSHIEQRMKDIYSRIGLTFQHLAVDFFAQGSYNRAFVVTSYMEGEPVTRRLLRVAKSLHPWFKTESEVATIMYLRTHTTIPVPKVYAFESSPNNIIGHEWMLMDFMPGRKYTELIEELGPVQQKEIVTTVHGYLQQLSLQSFNGIGSLYCDWESETPQFYLGKTVTQPLFYANRCGYPADRGPFRNLREYMGAHIDLRFIELTELEGRAMATLEVAERQRKRAAEKAAREDHRHAGGALGDGGRLGVDKSKELSDREVVGRSQRGSKKNSGQATDEDTEMESEENPDDDEEIWYVPADLSQLHRIFECFERIISKSNILDDVPVSTHLHHHDLHEGNILVDDTGRVTAIVDWEMIVALPKVLAGRPKFCYSIDKLTSAEIEEIFSSSDTSSTETPAPKEATSIKYLYDLMFWNGAGGDEVERHVYELEEGLRGEGNKR